MKYTVVIKNPTEPINLGAQAFGGVVSAAYDRELDDGKAVAVNEQMLEALKFAYVLLKDQSMDTAPVKLKMETAIAAAEAAKEV